MSGTPLSALWGHPIRFTSTRAIFYWFENFLQQPVPTSPQQIAIIIFLFIYLSIYLLQFGRFFILWGFLFVFISQIKVTGWYLICNHADLFSQRIFRCLLVFGPRLILLYIPVPQTFSSLSGTFFKTSYCALISANRLYRAHLLATQLLLDQYL